MRADKFDPRYMNRPSPRHVYNDFWDWLGSHPIWILGFVFAYVVYISTTEEV
jgi:hypothetical protein